MPQQRCCSEQMETASTRRQPQTPRYIVQPAVARRHCTLVAASHADGKHSGACRPSSTRCKCSRCWAACCTRRCSLRSRACCRLWAALPATPAPPCEPLPCLLRLHLRTRIRPSCCLTCCGAVPGVHVMCARSTRPVLGCRESHHAHTGARLMQMCPGFCRFLVPMLSSDAPDLSRHSAVRLVSRLASLLAGAA